MTFATVQDAYNAYRTKTVAELEQRAQEIKGIIETDPNADIRALNVELTAIKECKEDAEGAEQRGGKFDPITSMSMKAKSFDVETVADTAEYRSAFFKSMLGQALTADEQRAYDAGIKLAEQRADAFNGATDSMAVLPTETLNEIVKKARTIGGLMGECRAFNVPSKIAIPIGTPATKATWHVEGAEVEAEKIATASVQFEGYEILKVFSMSAKVRKMSISAFEAYLVDELTACVMECIADALVNGNGSAQGAGLESITWNEANSVTVGASASAGYSDVVELVAKLPRGYSAGAKFAMNNATLYRVFYGMMDGNKRPIFIADPQAESIGKILGFEVVVDDNIADNDVYFGNFGKYLAYNLPDGIAIETSRESSFRKGLIDYRALAIADCKPIVAEAFVKMTKASA